MKGREESLIIGSIVKKVSERYTNLSEIIIDEFFEETGIEMKTPTETQFFIGWLVHDFIFPGGKSFLSFAKDSIRLNEDEKGMIKRLENAVIGYFKIISWNGNVKVEDILTKKEYSVMIIDMQKPKTRIIKASLVKNLDEDYFFFGGIGCYTKQEEKEILSMTMLINGEAEK